MENNKEDLEKTQEIPIITEDMDITQPLSVIEEKEEITDSGEKAAKNYETLKKFIKTDVKTKETMFTVAPKTMDDYDEDSRIKYVDKLEETINDVGINFKQIAEGFEFGKTVLDAIKEFTDSLKHGITVGSYESGVGNQLYQKTITDMRPEFVEKVKDNCVGYTGAEPFLLADLLKESKTVNEALHVMHSYIMNNEEILENMPKIAEKTNTQKYPIALYGELNPVAKELFEKFPEELDVGMTDIISMPDKVLMMIRDRGHALTIDMDTRNPEEIDLKYFIPKLCNEEMVRALKGIDASSITRNGARGTFSMDGKKVAEEFFDFIESVPMDKDIPSVKMRREMEMQNNEQKQEMVQEQIIQSEKPIFSIEDAKSIAIEPERRMGRIESFQKKIAEIFNPLMSKFKGKESPEIESNITDRNVDDKNGNER